MKDEVYFGDPQERDTELMNKIISRWLYKEHPTILVSKNGIVHCINKNVFSVTGGAKTIIE